MMNEQNGHQEIYQKVNLFLDNQLNSEDQQDFISKIESNPSYSQVYKQEQIFRSIIKEKVNRHNVNSELMQTIMRKLKD